MVAQAVVSGKTRYAPGDAQTHSGRNKVQAATAQDTEIRAEGDTLVVRGDIDLYQAGRFRQQAEVHVRNTQQPRLDLTGVPFLDSAGLAALLALSRLAQDTGKTLRVAITGSPRRVLRITGIDRMLVLED